jgi:hypothetical protein
LVLIAKRIDVSLFLEACAGPEVTPFSNYKGIKCEGARVMGRLYRNLSMSKLENFSNKKKPPKINLIPFIVFWGGCGEIPGWASALPLESHPYPVIQFLIITHDSLHCLVNKVGTAFIL